MRASENLGRGGFCGRAGLPLLLVSAILLFSASMNHLSLKSYDDCFYAEKALEMWRRGAFFTVTWGGDANFGYPPLQLWIVGRSFALFGDNDFAARLPSLVMAVGVLLATYRIGVLTVGRWSALVACAALLLTPIFVTNARRCMMEIPLAFWTTAAILVYLEGLRRPWLLALLAVPLGAAILTKSVLGLFPLAIVAGSALSPALRRNLRSPWLWLGVLAGLALGASWTVHQTAVFGERFLREHYGVTIAGRVAGPFTVLGAISGYPLILLEHYQPVVLPAAVGLGLFLWKRRETRSTVSDVIPIWILVPIVLYSFSSARHPRFVFPLLPAMGLLSGDLVERRLPRLFSPIVCWVTPALCAAATLAFWIAPAALGGDANQVYKEHADLARSELPPGSVVPYLGGEYWPEANPLLRYWGVKLERAGGSPSETAAEARALPHRSMIVVRTRLSEVEALGMPFEKVVEGRSWAWVRFLGAEWPPGARADEERTEER